MISYTPVSELLEAKKPVVRRGNAPRTSRFVITREGLSPLPVRLARIAKAGLTSPCLALPILRAEARWQRRRLIRRSVTSEATQARNAIRRPKSVPGVGARTRRPETSRIKTSSFLASVQALIDATAKYATR